MHASNSQTAVPALISNPALSEGGVDFEVSVEVAITAESAEQAAQFALDDLRDLALAPIYFTVKNVSSGHVQAVSIGDALLPWERNDVQFPRLLAEIMATQDALDMAALAESMDLTIEEVSSLFDRAHQAWEQVKANVL